ncbi:hypothetical protein [Streptomyces sp. BE230]|uniref:hypothetical protein n=1 Tax=Streptomyces sp. BE230 TaxID=3002526 RepID=UPI002ED02F94|nr:hypothetical protein [Streptomyces sp. BE230]
MVIRRMKPLGFTLDETRNPLDATDRVDAGEGLDTRERGGLLEPCTRVRRAAAEQVTRQSASGSPGPRTSLPPSTHACRRRPRPLPCGLIARTTTGGAGDASFPVCTPTRPLLAADRWPWPTGGWRIRRTVGSVGSAAR